MTSEVPLLDLERNSMHLRLVDQEMQRMTTSDAVVRPRESSRRAARTVAVAAGTLMVLIFVLIALTE